MLRWRLILGAVFISALGFLVWLDNVSSPTGIWLFGLGVCVTILASGEIVHLMRSGGLDPQVWLVYLGNLVLITAAWVPITLGWVFPSEAWNWVAMCLGLCVVVAFLGEIYRYEKPGGAVANLSATLLGILYIGWNVLVLDHIAAGLGHRAADRTDSCREDGRYRRVYARPNFRAPQDGPRLEPRQDV